MEPSSAPCPGSNASILVVHDDPGVAARLRGVARPVMQAHDASGALAVLAAQPVAVLLCGEYLGGEPRGLQLLAAVRRSHPLTQLVLVSAGADAELLGCAINEVGVLRYLRDPADAAQLKEALDAALDHYRKACEIERLRRGYREMARRMRGLPYRLRQLRRAARLVARHGRELLLAAAVTLLALQAMFFGVGLLVLATLYLVKSLLGLDVLAGLHLEDLLGGWAAA